LFGTVLTPWNIYGDFHLFFANFFNIFGLLAGFFYMIGIFKHNGYPNKYGYFYVILLILAFSYSLILLFLPKDLTMEMLVLQASSQKLTQYTFLLCFAVQSFSLYKLRNLEKTI
jgi:hypothetical protein